MAESPAADLRSNRPKIIFTGCIGAGKTTAIQLISDIPPVVTEVCDSRDAREAGKPSTTVAMDYGCLRLANGGRVDLYGTPGQSRFDFMWEILGKNSAGLIVLLDATRPAPMDDLQRFLGFFLPIIGDAPVVVGLTKLDRREGAENDLPAHLQTFERPIPLHRLDARDPLQVKRLVINLLLQINPGILR